MLIILLLSVVHLLLLLLLLVHEVVVASVVEVVVVSIVARLHLTLMMLLLRMHGPVLLLLLLLRHLMLLLMLLLHAHVVHVGSLMVLIVVLHCWMMRIRNSGRVTWHVTLWAIVVAMGSHHALVLTTWRCGSPGLSPARNAWLHHVRSHGVWRVGAGQ